MFKLIHGMCFSLNVYYFGLHDVCRTHNLLFNLRSSICFFFQLLTILDLSLPECFVRYFAEKVYWFTDELRSSVVDISREFTEQLATASFNQFRSVTESDVAKFITTSSTTCELAPVQLHL